MAIGKDNNPLERDLSPEEIQAIINNYSSDIANNGLLKDVSLEDLQRYLSNPILNNKNLQKYAMYQYITEGDVFELFDLTRVLPNLNYNIKSFKPIKSDEKRILDSRKCISELNHKELTRDIVSQLISCGTVCGLIVGRNEQKSKDNPYVVLFNDLECFFPGRRVGGKWTVWCDLSYFTNSTDIDYKMDLLDNLSPYITEKDIKKYQQKNDVRYRYIELPIDRSVCLRTHTLRRNQRFGIPWNTQSIYNLKHKQKLRNLEKNVANKVINSVAILTIGDETNGWKKLGTKLTKSIFESVKKGLEKSSENESSQIVGLPEFANLKWADTNPHDALDPEKIESISDDVTMDTGFARGLITGKDTTYAVANLNLEIFFKRISELLENVEIEVYNKILKIILPKSVSDNYYFEYEKELPLSKKDRIGYLKQLSDNGYSIKYVIESLGLDFNEYIEQSKFEIEELKLRDIIIPPQLSYTSTPSDIEGSNGSEDTQSGSSESNEVSKDNNDNSLPKASK